QHPAPSGSLLDVQLNLLIRMKGHNNLRQTPAMAACRVPSAAHRAPPPLQRQIPGQECARETPRAARQPRAEAAPAAPRRPTPERRRASVDRAPAIVQSPAGATRRATTAVPKAPRLRPQFVRG